MTLSVNEGINQRLLILILVKQKIELSSRQKDQSIGVKKLDNELV